MGNSRGVRLPKPLIELAGLAEDVDLQFRDGTIVIAPFRAPRSGWADAAATLAEAEPKGLLDPSRSTHFDENEWRW